MKTYTQIDMDREKYFISKWVIDILEKAQYAFFLIIGMSIMLSFLTANFFLILICVLGNCFIFVKFVLPILAELRDLKIKYGKDKIIGR